MMLNAWTDITEGKNYMQSHNWSLCLDPEFYKIYKVYKPTDLGTGVYYFHIILLLKG